MRDGFGSWNWEGETAAASNLNVAILYCPFCDRTFKTKSGFAF